MCVYYLAVNLKWVINKLSYIDIFILHLRLWLNYVIRRASCTEQNCVEKKSEIASKFHKYKETASDIKLTFQFWNRKKWNSIFL